MRVYDTGSNANAGWYLYDETGSTLLFWVQGSAPNNSFVIAPNGRIGWGTNVPQTSMHVVSGAGPITFRMQDSGILPNTWDVEGGRRIQRS